MAQIGEVACTFVQDVVVPETLKGAVTTWRRPGMVGEGNQLVGADPGEFRYGAVYFGTQAEVEAWAVAIERLVGTITFIVDDWGTTYTNMLIKYSRPLSRSRADQGFGVPRVRGQIILGGTRLA